MLTSSMNSTDQIELHANMNETVGKDIYSNMETIRVQTDGNDRKKQGGKLPGADTTEVKYYRVAVVSLGLLCALLLAVIIWMVIEHTAETDQQQRNMELLEINKTKVDQENQRLTSENNDLMKKNSTLTAERERLQNTVRFLCTISHGWRCFGSSVYYISTSLKTWSDSRQHCMDQGADLVIIDSEEEQKFISDFRKNAWIGAMKTEGTWKWVDGKVLGNARYWAEGEPNDYQGLGENCVEIQFRGDTLRNWNDINCSLEKIYICEKAM